MIDENKKCYFCGCKVSSTYKQMRIVAEVFEECCEYDAGAEIFICGNCMGSFWLYIQENSLSQDKETT